MHGAIIQISKEPIGEDNSINVDKYYNGTFVPEHADYVRKMTDSERTAEITSLDSWLREIDCGKIEDDVLYVTNKENFFKEPYENFNQTLESLNQRNDFKTFVKGYTMEWAIRRLGVVFNGLHSYYVDWNDDEATDDALTLTDLFRELNDGDKIYIGELIDYHW